MNLKDIFTFSFKRINPFPGLAIDADTWRDAHNYSRDQLRLHNLMFHEVGIIEGLAVTSNEPQDLSVNIHPGIAIDSDGNTIIVQNMYHYQIQNQDKGTIYLIIQFREILEGPYQPPEGGQPTRILDGYRIQERDNLPDEPHLELARIDLDTTAGKIRNAEDKSQPGKNEINLNFRKEAIKPSSQSTTERVMAILPEIISPSKRIVIGYAVTNGSENNMHIHGLRNLTRELEMRYNWEVELEENVTLHNNIEQISLLYMTGGKDFKLSEDQQSSLKGFMNSNGVLLAEDCSEVTIKNSNSKKHGPVYNELIHTLQLELKPVSREAPILSNINLFSEIPRGAKFGIFLKSDNVIYSDNDYGCAWQGGCNGNPLSREAIRSAFEIGANIIEYAYQTNTSVPKQELIVADGSAHPG
jgi:hypothetical protein